MPHGKWHAYNYKTSASIGTFIRILSPFPQKLLMLPKQTGTAMGLGGRICRVNNLGTMCKALSQNASIDMVYLVRHEHPDVD